MTAPVDGSCGEPAWTAKVPKLLMGDGGLVGVSIGGCVTSGDISSMLYCLQCGFDKVGTMFWGHKLMCSVEGRQTG